MNLRTAAVIALAVFALSLATPALQFFSSSSMTSGWEAAFLSGTICVGSLIEPSNLKGLLLGTTAGSDLTLATCMSGTSANLLLLFAIGCAFRRKHTATLIAAGTALAAACLCMLALRSDRGCHLYVGVWLWVGSMLWLSAIAAWSVWWIEFGRGDGVLDVSDTRVPA
jgi:hypothetical protein